MKLRIDTLAFGTVASAALYACTLTTESVEATESAASADPFDVPVAGATHAEVAEFHDGDEAFGLVFREGDGLGPLYTQQSCAACHEKATRGPGSVQKMVVVLADGTTPSPDQSALAWGNTVHPLVAGGAQTPVVVPDDPSVKVSIRLGPPVLGRGYMEAVLDSEIERVAHEQSQRTDGIHGRANHVVYASEENVETRFPTHHKGDIVIGRFGLKARVSTLDDFTADAFQGDMGITTPLRPTEIVNPDGLRDDHKSGVDLGVGHVNRIAGYLRLVAIPKRAAATSDVGRAAFDEAKCSVCHAPTLHTRSDYPIRAIADIDAPLYTDVLLHDMGVELADGVVEGEAGPRDWRTLPLVGLRFQRAYLHDGRAATVEDAIMMHDGAGSEARESISIVRGMDSETRAALIQFVKGL